MTCTGRPGMCNMPCFGLLYTDIPTTGEYCHKKSVGVLSITGNGNFCVKSLKSKIIVWGDQPGLTTKIKQLQSFQSHIAKKIFKGKVTSAEALTLLRWVSLHIMRFGHHCCLTTHFDAITSTLSQQRRSPYLKWSHAKN